MTFTKTAWCLRRRRIAGRSAGTARHHDGRSDGRQRTSLEVFALGLGMLAQDERLLRSAIENGSAEM